MTIEITADRILYEASRQVYVAEGSVRVVQQGRSIEADWAVFNRDTLRGIAAGDVVMVDGEQTLEANFVEFDYDRQQGLVFGARLEMGEDEFVVGAAELLKTGELTYSARDASFSTCRCPDPDARLPWQLNAEDAQVEIGGYATATNVSLDILGIPTVWLPWMFFPVKTERESGILLPEFGYGSKNGFEVALPVFWAARDNVNVIATPRYLTKRGFKPEIEIETVYGERSQTQLYGTYVRDQDPEESVRGGRKQPEYDPDRWAVGFDNDVRLPGAVRVRSDIQIVSDNDFVRDFDDFRGFRKNRFLESTAFGFRHFGSDGSGVVVGGLAYADDRQNPDFDDRDRFLLQRAPSLSLDWLPSPVSGGRGLSFEMGVDYTHFRPYERAEDALDLASSEIVGDDLFADIGIAASPRINSGLTAQQRDLIGVGDGRFEEGEPLNDQGHRLILYPHLAHSFRLFDSIDVLPEVGWQQSLYTTRAQSFADRGLLMARLDLSSQLLGTLALLGLPETTHVLEPRLGWALVQHQSQRDNPLFIPGTAVPQTRLRQLSLDNVVLDDADRIDSANLLTLGLGNRFYGGGAGRRRLLADVSLSGGYDFAGSGTGHFRQLILDARTFRASGLRTHGILAYDLDRGRIDEGLAEVGFPGVVPWVKSSSITLGYRYRKTLPRFFETFPGTNSFDEFKRGLDEINQVQGTARVQLNPHWALGSRQIYSIKKNLHQTNSGFIEYTSRCRCWAIRVDLADDRNRGFQANVSFSVLGFGGSADRPFAGKQTRFGSRTLD